MPGHRWTESEIATLRALSEKRLPIVQNMHLLPGRTIQGAKSLASKLKISLAGADDWTPEDIAVLRKIYRTKRSIKLQVAELLPHRTYVSAKAEARRLGIAAKEHTGTGGRKGYSWVLRSVEMLLERDGPATSKELARKCGGNERTINALIKANRKRFYVAGWSGAAQNLAVRWDLGNLPDVPKPPRVTPNEASRVYRLKRRIRAGSINPFEGLILQVAA